MNTTLFVLPETVLTRTRRILIDRNNLRSLKGPGNRIPKPASVVPGLFSESLVLVDMARRIAAAAFVLALTLPEAGSSSIPLTRHVVRVPYSTSGRSMRGSAEERGFVGLRDRRTQDEVPVIGEFRDLAYFYADVFIGTPSQKFTVIAGGRLCE